MKKKILAIAMAAAMMASMGSLAFAENTAGGSTEVTVDVPKTYTVTIPAKVTASTDASTPMTFACDTAMLASDDILKITVTESNLELTGKNGKDTITVDMKYGADADSATVVAAGGTVANLKFDKDTKKATDANSLFLGKADAAYAGTYSGTLNFTVELVEQTSAT